MPQVFKPENVFFVHGHGGSKEIFNARLPTQTSAPNPFGERTEFERIEVPKNVYTASIFEAGLAAPPQEAYITALKTFNNDVKVPEFNQSYYTYTKSLQTLGEKLFPYIFPPGTSMDMLYENFNYDYQMQYGMDMPKRLRTHGHQHPAYASLTQPEQKRDYFLFSTPNDEITLLTTILTGNSRTRKTIGSITIVKDYLISGIIPLNELKGTRGIYQVGTVLPTQFYSRPMKDWDGLLATLPAQTYLEWKELVKMNMEDLAYFKVDASVSNSNFDIYTDDTCQEERKKLRSFKEESILKMRKETIVLKIINARNTRGDLDNREFGKQFIQLMIKNLKEIFFWSTHFATEAEFLNKSLDSISTIMTSDEIIRRIQQKRGTQEPVLILFYHCRSIPQRLISGDYYNDPMAGLATVWQTNIGRPLLARSYSRTAYEGNATTQGLTNLQLAAANRRKRSANFATLKRLGFANKNISNAYYKANADLNVATQILQQQQINRQREMEARAIGVEQSYNAARDELARARGIRMSRNTMVGGIKLKRKTRQRRRTNRRTRKNE